MVYPVNSDLLSLRSLPNQFSVMSLLAAAFLMLEYRESPSRLGLLGVWLGLVFNVVTNETAYAIILVAPLLWVSPFTARSLAKCEPNSDLVLVSSLQNRSFASAILAKYKLLQPLRVRTLPKTRLISALMRWARLPRV